MQLDFEELVIQLKERNVNLTQYGDTGVELSTKQNKTIGVCKANSLEESLAEIIAKLSGQKQVYVDKSQLSLL